MGSGGQVSGDIDSVVPGNAGPWLKDLFLCGQGLPEGPGVFAVETHGSVR